MTASKELMLADSDIGKKVYEFEQEITLVIKTQVIGKNETEAFDKWLNETSTRNIENYDIKDNMTDVVNSYFKEYSHFQGTKEIGTIKKADESDEDSELEVV
jgi:hypothetical protein|tara:strand:- start:64 stop:369 length:306 start_codon:yes stop_codon:yes gene_type:complete